MLQEPRCPRERQREGLTDPHPRTVEEEQKGPEGERP